MEDFDSTPAPLEKSVDRNMIHRLSNHPEDNYRLWEEDTEEMQVIFQGYDENPEAFAWLSRPDWERFQTELKAISVQKRNGSGRSGSVCTQIIIQQINPYERNVYLDADYKTEDMDTMKMKAVCDAYKDDMRFTFFIQYGD